MSGNKGFTLLEVLIVVGIMAFIAAMVWPMLGTLDDAQRRRMTMDKMQAIEEALLGPEQGILGGYVGDMCRPDVPDSLCAWPELWEPDEVGSGGMDMDSERGAFDSGRFRWAKPFVPVADIQQESLGQPRGLWTRYLSGQDDADTLPEEHWLGPYLSPPVTGNPDLGKHFASNQDEYEQLSQFPGDRKAFHLLQGQNQLTDGWNRAFRFFISQEHFWMISLNSKHRDLPLDFDITDYATCDDLEAEGYLCRRLSPAKGLEVDQAASVWTSIRRHIIRQSLGFTDPQQLIIKTEDQLDRIVRSLVGDAPAAPNTGYTADLLTFPDLWNFVCRFDRDEPGESDPVPCHVCRDEENNIGYVGVTACADYPEGRWEQEFNGDGYTYGQPRGLWDQGDLIDSQFGIGWRHRYHHKPGKSSGDPDINSAKEYLKDAWGRPLHFFMVRDNGKEHLMIVSTGESERGIFHRDDPAADDFAFPQPEFSGDLTGFNDYLERHVETFNLADYQPDFTGEIGGVVYDNTDNIVRLVRLDDWQPGFMDLKVSLDADLDGLSQTECTNHESNDYKCRVYGLDGSPAHREGSFETEWVKIQEDPEEYACRIKESLHFKYDDKASTDMIISGGRYLICWDSAEKAEPDTDDWNRIFSVFANPARIVDREILLKMSDFE